MIIITISFVKINISILMPKQIVCVNIAKSRVISIISINAQWRKWVYEKLQKLSRNNIFCIDLICMNVILLYVYDV